MLLPLREIRYGTPVLDEGFHHIGRRSANPTSLGFQQGSQSVNRFSLLRLLVYWKARDQALDELLKRFPAVVADFRKLTILIFCPK